MALFVDIKKRLPQFDLEISFTAEEGELKVLIGPSGAGKTTLVRIIAGLEKPDEGSIRFNGEVWVDTSKGLCLPPQQRKVGYVFQDYTLFPHLSVFKNVAFCARDRREVEPLLRLFGIWDLREFRPQNISGGERQRCAICQSLARGPRVLLLDEPFSALDVENRRKLRRELKTLKNEMSLPMIHVTHELHEALFLGDDILSIVRGKVTPEWLSRQLEEISEDEIFHPASLDPARKSA
ncbi:MAG: ATP-binding cassette domain-containing protein [Pseudomonadota bacterium]